jgi:hypothetical protein
LAVEASGGIADISAVSETGSPEKGSSKKVSPMRISLVPLALTLCIAAVPAMAFGVNRNGCSITATNGAARLTTRIVADDFGTRRGPKETTITFSFPDNGPLTEGLTRSPGEFAITVEPEGQSDRGEYPWREVWPVVGTDLRLSVVPLADGAAVNEFLFVAKTAEGEETVHLTHREEPAYNAPGNVAVTGNGWEIPRGVDMLNLIETASSFELRAVGAGGAVLAAASFDSSEGAQMIATFTVNLPETEELYEVSELIDRFDCDYDAPL